MQAVLRLAVALALSSTALALGQEHSEARPWSSAGLTDREAVVHALNRLAFGPRPGEVARILEQGLGAWLESQLAGGMTGARAEEHLAKLPALALSRRDIAIRYGDVSNLVQRAARARVLSAADYYGQNGERRQQVAEAAFEQYAKDQKAAIGERAIAQLREQKLYRALYSESQLEERLVSFWSNHFNVAVQKTEVHALSFERDAIRPFVFGRFRDMLGAVARHPAMLVYLDNRTSRAAPRTRTMLDVSFEELSLEGGSDPTFRQRLQRALVWRPTALRAAQDPYGINENYARELMELHTLGVDGGYTQRDVVEVARAFTGWSALALVEFDRFRFLEEDRKTAESLGFVIEDFFVFRPDYHDAEPKRFLGISMDGEGGFAEGETVLDVLSAHPSTSRHLARALARRFVSDDPSLELTDRLATTFELSGGDLREVVRVMVESAEFWDAARTAPKLKSPFEFAVSALRAVDAEVLDPKPVLSRLGQMGQHLYGYSPPTGYPDASSTWRSAGLLLHRLNFGLDLASGRIAGVRAAWLELVSSSSSLTVEDSLDALRAQFLELSSEDQMAPLIALSREQETLASPEANVSYAVSLLLTSPSFQVR